MALYSVLFDVAAKTAAFESSMKNIERRFDSVASYAKKAGGIIGVAFGAEMFRQGILGSIELGDEMGKLAEKTGITARAASELSRVFEQNDFDNGTLATSLRKMQVELSKGNDIFGKLGLSVEQLKSKDADLAFEDIAQRISEIPDAADRSRVAVEIFGKAGADLLPLLMQGASGIQAMRKELGGLSDDDVRKLQAADDAIKELEFLKQGFWNNIAVGIVTVAQALDLMDKPRKIELSEQLDGLLEQRRELLGDIQSESNAGAFSKWWYGTEGERSLEAAQGRLSALNEQINAVNQQLLGLDKADLIEVSFNAADLNGDDEETRSQMAARLKLAEQEAETRLFIERMVTGATHEMRVDGSALYAQLMAEEVDLTKASREAMLQDAQAAADKTAKVLADSMERFKPWAEEMNRSTFSAFSDGFYNLGSGVDGFAEDMINAFKRVLANEATVQLFEMLAGMGKSMKKAGSEGGNEWLSAIGGFFGSVFGGTRDSGGRGEAGKGYMIGKGAQPEMFWPDSAGTFVPNVGGGGMTYSPVYNIDARGATQELVKALPAALKRTEDAAVARMMQMRSEGRF